LAIGWDRRRPQTARSQAIDLARFKLPQFAKTQPMRTPLFDTTRQAAARGSCSCSYARGCHAAGDSKLKDKDFSKS
ncbi:MAG TPA: hypothetical protein VJT13_20945, partial [Xanthobacteraceae bacterium]|nr:hypothetical protein [Xanthobacteraceae bacterium]